MSCKMWHMHGLPMMTSVRAKERMEPFSCQMIVYYIYSSLVLDRQRRMSISSPQFPCQNLNHNLPVLICFQTAFDVGLTKSTAVLISNRHSLN